MDDKVAELQARIDVAIEQLHSLANEYIHRSHGCQYPELNNEDLEEVIDILRGERSKCRIE